MSIQQLNKEYQEHYESSLFGRYVTLGHIKHLLEKLRGSFKVSVLGKSVLAADIHFVEVGRGKTKVLMWSQMHGNESTTTKAVFDLLNVLYRSESNAVDKLLSECTIGVIPMLNPDGAQAYTRLNANQIDLNRDAQALSQPESKILKDCFDRFRPDFCFNLHDQRTIFSAGPYRKSAVISFLSPSQDEMRSVTKTRKRAMAVVVAMNQVLQEQIPGQVGIYDDTFNLNCVGDLFQSMNVPTVLFEAGHFKGDYNREKVRKLIFQSLWVGLTKIASDVPEHFDEKDYFEIPENKKLFYDIIIRNVKVKNEEGDEILDVGLQYQESLCEDRVVFVPKIEKTEKLNGIFGHQEIDAKGEMVVFNCMDEKKGDVAIDFVLINDKKHSLSVNNSRV